MSRNLIVAACGWLGVDAAVLALFVARARRRHRLAVAEAQRIDAEFAEIVSALTDLEV